MQADLNPRRASLPLGIAGCLFGKVTTKAEVIYAHDSLLLPRLTIYASGTWPRLVAAHPTPAPERCSIIGFDPSESGGNHPR
jgi:hypothetical protein